MYWGGRKSPDDDTLILSVDHHVSVHVISQGVDVGGVLILGLEKEREEQKEEREGQKEEREGQKEEREGQKGKREGQKEEREKEMDAARERACVGEGLIERGLND